MCDKPVFNKISCIVTAVASATILFVCFSLLKFGLNLNQNITKMNQI